MQKERWNFLLQQIRNLLKENQILTHVPMKDYTSMHVGGIVKMLLLPSRKEEIGEIKKLLHHLDIPHYVVGNGTNLVVADEGYSGVIIKLSDNFSDIFVCGNEMTALSGASMASLSNSAMRESLSGLEFASGIPGTVGGAVAMNAGAYDGEMKNVVIETTCIDGAGETVILRGAEHKFGYRTSHIQKSKLIVLEVKMRLIKGETKQIQAKMQELNRRRREKQPLNLPSAGSAFKRPAGYYAAKLIEDAGLKGYRIGGAQVSVKHCGFIVNTGDATATDVIQLMEYVKKRVFQNSGVMLEQEIRVLGG